MLAPELLNRPLQPRRLVAPRDDLVADALQFVQAEVAAVLDDQLEAAGGAQAVDRRRAEGRHDGPAHLLAGSAPAIAAAMASAVRLGPRRWSNS